MGKKHVSEIQCPNCGEYQMGKAELFGAGHIFLAIITLGLYALVKAIIETRSKDPTLTRGERIRCRNCGSRYIFES